ncbi:hypothetical protein CPB83DRAFT_605473 [Crepidotus variabilis]|uniref:Uncharacterized protein n=1 Tax=Crepidotus variabilis TaxID=179855 RepID=A0A9P6JKU2_9AGAR|nr:hypothetical protein CPB83DRAFT_605473 [Crepidotus variabilis]
MFFTWTVSISCFLYQRRGGYVFKCINEQVTEYKQCPLTPMTSLFSRFPNELLALVIILCDWRSLGHLYKLDDRLDTVIRAHLFQRVQRRLAIFVPVSLQFSFWQCLDVNRGCIFGGVARITIAGDHSAYDSAYPRQLDLMFSSHSPIAIERMGRLLRKAGYLAGEVVSTGRYYRGEVVRAMKFMHATSQMLSICVLQSSSPSLLRPILKSPHTSMHNILTASNSYSFYPRLLDRHISVASSSRFVGVPSFLYNFGLTTYGLNQLLDINVANDLHTEICGLTYRQTFNLPGVEVVEWGHPNQWPGVEEGLEWQNDGFGEENHMWRIGTECFCSSCDYQLLPLSVQDI